MDLGRRHESSGAAPPFHDAFALQRSQGVTGGHQAYLMDPGQLSFRIHHIARLQLPGLDAFPDYTADSFVSRGPVSAVLCHE